MKRIILFLSLAAILYSCYKSEKADLIIHNAKIYTVNEGFEVAEAMAILDGKIIELGPDREILNRYQSEEVIDAKGMSVYPGFIDAHSHFSGYALGLTELNLYGSLSYNEVLVRAEKFQTKNQRDWLIGRGWDQTTWENKEFPTKEKLDSLFPDIPVYLTRVDGHAVLVNSKALEIAGIDESTSIKGGAFIKDANGKLNGVLLDNAQNLFSDHLKAPDPELLKNLLLQAEKNCFEAGLTTVCDAGIDRDLVNFYDSLYRNKELTIRIYGMLNPNEENEWFLTNGPIKTANLNVSSFKLYCDGALGSRGAALKDPYADDPENTGMILHEKQFYLNFARKCMNSGFQLNTHCIGDSAVSLILNTYADVLSDVNDLRWRIEHAQIVDPKDLSLFREYAIIPSVQPTHATSDMDWAGDRLGPERVNNAYVYNSLKEQLGLIALGTDFPVEDISPIKTFYAAVFRKDINGNPESGYKINEALSREDALRGMTIWAAIASFEEENRGSLEAGKNADFVILDRDLMISAESDILKTNVLLSSVGGKIVYSRQGF